MPEDRTANSVGMKSACGQIHPVRRLRFGMRQPPPTSPAEAVIEITRKSSVHGRLYGPFKPLLEFAGRTAPLVLSLVLAVQ
jgi:hypothetical protein